MANKKIEFSWTHENPNNEAVTYTLYHYPPNGDGSAEKVVQNIATMKFSFMMNGEDQGRHQFHVTATNEFGESPPSNAIIIEYHLPKAPVLDFTIA